MPMDLYIQIDLPGRRHFSANTLIFLVRSAANDRSKSKLASAEAHTVDFDLSYARELGENRPIVCSKIAGASRHNNFNEKSMLK